MSGWDEATLTGADTTDEWQQLLTEHPKVLWGLVADVVKAVKAAEGVKKTGRRPAVSVGSLDELYTLLFPTFSTARPFPEAFGLLLEANGYTQRSFSQTIGFNQATVSRLVAGKSEASLELMERIAYTLNVRPTYFVEYRAAKLAQVLANVLLTQPHVSAEAVRRLSGARP